MILESYFPQIPDDKLLLTMKQELELFKKNLGPGFGNLAPEYAGFESIFLEGSNLQQKTFIARFKLYNEIFSTVEPDTDVSDLVCIWKVLKKFKMRPPSDLMTKISASDYVEIRDQNGVQIFGNFNFLKQLSYSVEEIFWYSWDELFSRDKKITELIMSEFIKSVSTATESFDPNIPEHQCWETRSTGGHTATVKMQMFSPVFGENKSVRYMLATSKIKRASEVSH